MKKIAILGSTGSIGTNTLKVIDSNPYKYEVVGLVAGRNIDLLLDQIENFKPLAVAVSEMELANCLRKKLKNNSKTEVLWGIDGFVQIASLTDVDMVVSAMSGAIGLIPTYEAIKAGKDIAIANKETMVIAGPVIMAQVKKQNVSILPVDSEHSAVFQSIQGHQKEDLSRIILTASGGPFREKTLEELENITPDEALRHPNWDMGKKISIDSATLMNKGLETIEAKWLFDIGMDQIDILIHPESIIHSMVEYKDGAVIAQLGIPHMITPISYALSYPRHVKTNLPPLKLEDVGQLTFQKPDMKRFKCLGLALRAAQEGDTMPAVLNGANEVAVEAFLDGRIGFLDIPLLIEQTMEAHDVKTINSMEEVLEADRWARETAEKELPKLHRKVWKA